MLELDPCGGTDAPLSRACPQNTPGARRDSIQDTVLGTNQNAVLPHPGRRRDASFGCVFPKEATRRSVQGIQIVVERRGVEELVHRLAQAVLPADPRREPRIQEPTAGHVLAQHERSSWTERLRRRGVSLRWIALGCVLAAVVIGSVKAAEESLAYDAVTVAPASARAEPSDDSTVEFRLPPGSPVNLGRRTPEWREVIVSSSLRGWVPDAAVAALADPR